MIEEDCSIEKAEEIYIEEVDYWTDYAMDLKEMEKFEK